MTENAFINRKTKNKGNTYEIRFLLYQNVFNVLEPLVTACKKVSTIHAVCIIDDVSVVSKGYVEWCSERDIEYVFGKEYDVQADRPDVMVVFNSNTYPQFPTKGFRENTRLIVVVSSFLMPCVKTIWEHELLIAENFGDFLPDYYIYDKYLYRIMINSRLIGNRCIEMGNPKYDGIYNGLVSGEVFPKEWGKLYGKKTILWAPAHTYKISFDGRVEADPRTTFDQYVNTIISYFSENKDINLILRPHPEFFPEMKKVAGWTDSEINEFRTFFSQSDNMILDEHDDYNYSYSVMDAVMTDVQCHICFSALPLRKPIAVLYRRGEKIESNAPEITDIVYNLHSESDIIDFLDMINRGDDPLENKRVDMIPQYVKYFDGMNGERVVRFLLEKVNKGYE